MVLPIAYMELTSFTVLNAKKTMAKTPSCNVPKMFVKLLKIDLIFFLILDVQVPKWNAMSSKRIYL